MGFDKHKSPRYNAQREEKLRAGYRMLIEGHGYAEIARAVGYADRSTCRRALVGYIKARHAETNELADTARQVILDQYDTVLVAVFRNAITGDVQAIDRVVKILERKSRLLNLEAGPTVEIGVTSVDLDDDIRRLTSMLLTEAADRTGVELPELAALEYAANPPTPGDEEPVDAEVVEDEDTDS